MAQLDEEIQLKWMQNITDKIDELNNKVEYINESKTDDNFSKIITTELAKIASGIETNSKKHKDNYFQIDCKIQSLNKKVSTINPTVNNQVKRSYNLFGKDSPFTSKLLLTIILVLVLSSYAFKYIPSYIIAHSEIKAERDDLRNFYDYWYLSNFQHNGKFENMYKQEYDNIKNGDKYTMNQLKQLKSNFATSIRKAELLDELKNLK